VPIALRAVCSDGGGGELEVKRSLFETPAPEQADSKAAKHPAIHPAMPALSALRRPRRGCAGGLACGKGNIDRSPRRLRVGATLGALIWPANQAYCRRMVNQLENLKKFGCPGRPA
jgi:hypothetical protein